MNGEKKSLRKKLSEMSVGEIMAVKREEYRPSVVRTSAYFVGSDFNIKLKVHMRDYGVDVVRVA